MMSYFLFNKRISSLLLILCVVLTFNLSAQVGSSTTTYDSLIIPSKKYGFHSCSKSNVPVFNMPVNSVLEMEIKTDFEKLFQTEKSEQSRIEGTLTYVLNDSQVVLPIKIKARGKTRFVYCKYKPLDIKFSSSTDSTIFDGLGEKFDITTHCGITEGDQWILEGTRSEHRNRLLAEYYIYSILETLGTVTRSVSLCKLKYINNKDSVLIDEFAFIVEPDEVVAERCDLIKDKTQIQYLDKSSLINTMLMNHFVTNYDWNYEYVDSTGWIRNNIKILKSEDSLGYILPYDFDLNAISYPNYWKNRSESFDEHCYRFQEILIEHFSDKKKLEAPYKILINIPVYKTMIKESYMDTSYKQKFLYWLDSYEFILLNHLSQYRRYKRKLHLH